MAEHHLRHGTVSAGFWGRAGLGWAAGTDSPGVHLDGVVPRVLRNDVGQRGLSQTGWATEQGYLQQRGKVSEAGLPPAPTKAATHREEAVQPANLSASTLGSCCTGL